MSAQQNWVGLVMRRGGAEAHVRRVKKNWMEVCQRHCEQGEGHPQAIDLLLNKAVFTSWPLWGGQQLRARGSCNSTSTDGTFVGEITVQLPPVFSVSGQMLREDIRVGTPQAGGKGPV